MKKLSSILIVLFFTLPLTFVFLSFSEKGEFQEISQEVKIEHGKYIVETYGCAHCHTPKKMTDRGPAKDKDLWLSGHNSKAPMPEIDPSLVAKGWVLSNMDNTAHLGPWGVSYSANITSDDSGIGLWNFDQFKASMTQGKHKGMDNSRVVLPPMPWTDYIQMNDEDLESLFAYLKSTKAIKNVVPTNVPIDKL
jgi:hypothetical protein